MRHLYHWERGVRVCQYFSAMNQILTLTLPPIFAFTAACAHAASPEILVDPGGYRDYPNLLHNRSFEAHPHINRPDKATRWACREGASRDFESGARTGSCAVKFSGKGTASQTLTLLPNPEYTFRVFRRGTGEGLKLQAFADRRTPLGEIAAKDSSETWQELSLKFRTPEKLRDCTVTISI